MATVTADGHSVYRVSDLEAGEVAKLQRRALQGLGLRGDVMGRSGNSEGVATGPDREEKRCMRPPAASPPGSTDRSLEQTILALLEARAAGATICPSEAARAVGGEEWRPLMPSVREAAGRLVGRGELEITQGGRVVDGSTAKGPIRLRRVTPPSRDASP